MVYTDKKRLVADYFEELVMFGKTIGLQPERLQDINPDCRHAFFELTPALCERAIKRGAITINSERGLLIAYEMKRYGEDKLMPDLGAADDELPVINCRTGQAEIF